MPELPEVETVMRGLEPAMLGHELTRVHVRRADLRKPVPKAFSAQLQGKKIKEIRRRGKYILAFMEDGAGFALHLGMSGRVRILPPGGQHAQEKHDHLEFHMRGGSKIVFNDARRFGMVFLINRSNWQQHAAFSHMGPEPLGNDFSGPVLAKKLKGRTTPIKTVLLDQSVVAGVGNIYACEALYYAGISPRRQAGTVQRGRAEKLAVAIRKVLEKAIRAGGSTLKDYRHADGGLGYFQHHFSVYDREGMPCPDRDCECQNTGGIQRIIQAGRSTFFCPRKQR